MGINYLLNSQTELRFNYSFHQRAPNPAELFSDGLHHGAARIELGDLRITQEQGHKIGVSASGNSGIWAWDISPYINFLDGFIYLEPTGVEQTIRGAFPVWEYRQADARIWELMHRHKLNGRPDGRPSTVLATPMVRTSDWMNL